MRAGFVPWILALGLVTSGCSTEASTAHSPARVQPSPSGEKAPAGYVDVDVFFALFAESESDFRAALHRIDTHWRDGYAIMLMESVRFLLRSKERVSAVVEVLQRRTGLRGEFDDFFHWVWDKKPTMHPNYARFKASLYEKLDKRFAAYFDSDTETARIRLDEVRWGGVARDGIPPLKNPKMLTASKARYLADDNVVFGIEVNGDARAYPKRILAWHEMFKDTVGDVSINGVYCTLCGSMIVYRTHHRGVHYELGTSGFLYRSNKLMYDHQTESMWSTMTGEPVIGPLVGHGIVLEPMSVVTTTWGEWRRRHPHTTVLSLRTGHKRDYGEGVAYRKYFASDELMFTVPTRDTRLKNKAEVLALRFGGPSATPTAIAASFLAKRPVHHGRLGDTRYLVLTDASGANRVYDAGHTRWVRIQGKRVLDSDDNAWRIEEQRLVGPGGRVAKRLPAHRAFWFGWHAAHPETRLIRDR